ncbi:MAG: alpha/beta hydrolase [Merismopedia sp. SIO2A8]|nr:alpha/beta hydrolase [Symploca sp. SIO2B6]NET52913.1 alpha/beta hydrolase [Merismopedia sp. SIO2A8]
MSSPTRQTLHLPTIDLSYLEWQPLTSSATTPVLLLHGLADHAGVWRKLGEQLALTHPVVAPDLRGHGQSGKPDSGYAHTDILADLAALLDHLGWTTTHIVGHSWSAKLACIWATQSPERFRKLVLFDPAFTGKFPTWTRVTFPLFYRILPFLKMMGPFETYTQAEQQAKTLKQYKQWSLLQEAVFKEGMVKNADGTWSSQFCMAARDGVFEDFTQVSALTAPINIPTLLVRPEKGLNQRSFQLNPYKQFISNLEIQCVPGNHWAFTVDPNTVNPIMIHFLEGHC